jgi:hypothetical protein
MSFGVRALPDELRGVATPHDAWTAFGNVTIAAGVITISATASPLTRIVPLIKIINNSSLDVAISWDGVNIHDYVPTNGFTLYDICSDTKRENGLYIGIGTQFYAQAIGGGTATGNVYMVCIYPYQGAS